MSPLSSHRFSQKLCLVEEAREFDGSPATVFVVSKAVGDVYFEKAMVGILAHLIDVTGTALVCIEAGSGNDSLAFLRSHADREKREQVGAEFIDKGLLSAAEYLSLVSDGNWELWGVENRTLYDLGMAAMQPLIPMRERWTRLLDGVVAEVDDMGMKLVSGRLRSFISGGGSEATESMDEFRVLLDLARELKLDISKWPQCRRLVGLYRLETEIEFAKANQEQSEFLVLLGRTFASTERLILDSFRQVLPELDYADDSGVAARLEEISEDDASAIQRQLLRTPVGRLMGWWEQQGEVGSVPADAAELQERYEGALDALKKEMSGVFEAPSWAAVGPEQLEGAAQLAEVYEYVVDLMSLLGLGTEEYPNLVRAAQYYCRLASVDVLAVVAELESVRQAALNRLCETESDFSFVRLRLELRQLRAVLGLVAQSGDVASLELSSVQHLSGLCHALEPLIPESAYLKELRHDELGFDASIDKAMNYYAVMKARGDAMVDNTVARLRDTGQSSCLLLVGGFHKHTVTAKLGQAGISHVVIMPKWTTAQDGPNENYFELLRQQERRSLDEEM